MLRQILAVPVRKIIQNSNRMAIVQQRMHQMRADKPSAAGHEKTSHPKSLKLFKEALLGSVQRRPGHFLWCSLPSKSARWSENIACTPSSGELAPCTLRFDESKAFGHATGLACPIGHAYCYFRLVTHTAILHVWEAGININTIKTAPSLLRTDIKN